MLMRISKARIDQYRDELNTLADLASDYVKAFVELMLQENPNIGVAELRQATIEAIEESLNVFGVEASSLAGELFDEIMLGEGISAKAAVGRTIEAEAVDKKVRTYAQELVNGNATAFTKKVTDITNYYIKREAYQSMIDNCERNDVRWARVPSGRETCSFCFMLASRGFVYLSEEKAKGAHGMHRNCDCAVVPGIPGVTKIAGYDPDALYRRWKQCADKANVDPETTSDNDRKKILREVNNSDYRWLYSGEKKRTVQGIEITEIENPFVYKSENEILELIKKNIDYSLMPRNCFGRQIVEGDYSEDNIVDRKKEWRDIIVHDILAALGKKVTARARNSPDGYSDIDIFIGEKLYEIKSPYEESENKNRFIESNLRKAKKQFLKQYDPTTDDKLDYSGDIRVILNLSYKDASGVDVESQILKHMEGHKIDEVILIDKQSPILRFVRKAKEGKD